MKRFFGLLFFCLLSSSLLAGSAISVAESYFNDLKKRDFVAASSHFDKAQLKEFREMMGFYKSLPQKAQVKFVRTFFGHSATLETMSSASDEQFFAAFFGAIMRQAETVGSLNFDKFEILGKVEEGEDIAHLVTRNTLWLGDMEIEQMEVVTLKNVEGSWQLQLSGKIRGIPGQLKSVFERAR